MREFLWVMPWIAIILSCSSIRVARKEGVPNLKLVYGDNAKTRVIEFDLDEEQRRGRRFSEGKLVAVNRQVDPLQYENLIKKVNQFIGDSEDQPHTPQHCRRPFEIILDFPTRTLARWGCRESTTTAAFGKVLKQAEFLILKLE